MAKAKQKRTYYVVEVDEDTRVATAYSVVGGRYKDATAAKKAAPAIGEPGKTYAVIAQCGPAFHVNVKTTERRSIVPVGAQKTEGTEDE